jgi:uncharacterized protein (UPF0261 family)
MADDRFGKQAGLEAPATTAFAVTPDDDDELSEVTRALYVGVAGDVAVVMAEGSSAVTFVGVPAGSILPLRVKKIMATNTDATDIVGLV